MPEKSNKQNACGCAIPLEHPNCLTAPAPAKPTLACFLMPGLAGFLLWGFIYHSLASFAAWFTHSLLPLPHGSHLGATVEFFPEAIILRKVLKPRLIATFFGVVALGILIVGYLFNFIM